MNYKLKALGLALLAIAALTVLAAPAQAGKLDLGAQSSVITGQNEANQFPMLLGQEKTGGEEGKLLSFCTQATFEGTASGVTLESALVTPLYRGACLLYGQLATVRMNGCKYTLTGAGQAANTAVVDIVACTPGKQITIQSPVCQVVIPEQNNLSHVVGTNQLDSPHSVTLAATITGIKYTQVGAGCPDGNNHQSTNGSYTANTVVKAFAHPGARQVTLHGHQYEDWPVATSALEVGSSPAVITGQQENGSEHVLSVPLQGGSSLKINCALATFEGTAQAQTAAGITTTATYAFCKSIGPTTVQMNGCRYALTGAPLAADTAYVDIVGCTEGKSIVIQTGVCQFSIPEQKGLSHVVATNQLDSPHSVTLNATVTGITVTKTGAFCLAEFPGQVENATFEGKTIVKAFKDLGTELTKAHEHQYTRSLPGEQVSLTSTTLTSQQVSVTST